MTARHRILALLVAALALGPASGSAAAVNPAYSRVASAFAIAQGRLDPCAFTKAQLEAALAGIPKSIANVVPDLKKAIRDAIAAHERGACKGRKPGGATVPPGAAGGVGAPPETTTPTTTSAAPPPGTTVPGTATTAPTQPATPAPVAPAATTPAAPAVQPPAASSSTGSRDRTPLAVAAIAIGGLLLAALLLWLLARMRGWDAPWQARARHAWGEAGFRATGTWSEFTDWLRLGR